MMQMPYMMQVCCTICINKDDYIYFFNNMRPHKRLKNMTPVEYETEYYKKISEDKLDDCIPY